METKDLYMWHNKVVMGLIVSQHQGHGTYSHFWAYAYMIFFGLRHIKPQKHVYDKWVIKCNTCNF